MQQNTHMPLITELTIPFRISSSENPEKGSPSDSSENNLANSLLVPALNLFFWKEIKKEHTFSLAIFHKLLRAQITFTSVL